MLRRAGADVTVASVESSLQVCPPCTFQQPRCSRRVPAVGAGGGVRCLQGSARGIIFHFRLFFTCRHKRRPTASLCACFCWQPTQSQAGLQVECARKVKVVADKLIGDCANENYDLIALPVGGGRERGGGCVFITNVILGVRTARPGRCTSLTDTCCCCVCVGGGRRTGLGWEGLQHARTLRHSCRLCLRHSNPLHFYPTPLVQGGMPGAERLRDCDVLTQMVDKQRAADKLHAAICATPAVAFEPHGALARSPLSSLCLRDRARRSSCPAAACCRGTP